MAHSAFLDVPVSMGTTVIAACYDGGAMIAADTRTSSGRYIANRAADKINMLTENIFMARSGTAAHTQAVRDHVIVNLEYHALQLNDEVPVKTAATMIENILYRNKDAFHAGIIVAGYDKHDGGSVYQVSLGGTLIKEPFVMSGSGSAYIHGFFDKYWRTGMSEEQCREFMIQAVAHAMSRDVSSGGCIRLVSITKTGAKQAFISADQVPITYKDLKA